MNHQLIQLCFILLWSIQMSCSDSGADASQGPTDTAIDDGSTDAGAQLRMDGGSPDGRTADAIVPDAVTDGAVIQDGGPRLVRVSLQAADAMATGRHTRLSDGRIIVDPNGQLEWSYPAGFGGERVAILEATIWRLEDGFIELDIDGETQRAMVRGDGTGRPELVHQPDSAWVTHGAGPDAEAPLIYLPLDDAGGRIAIRSVGGSLVLRAVHLSDSRDTILSRESPSPWEPTETIEYIPCAEPGCDDGMLLSDQIAASQAERLQVNLAPGRYHLFSQLRVERSWVRIQGDSADPAVLFWDPATGSGRRGAIEVLGPGVSGDALPLRAELAFGERRFIVQGEIPLDTRWVRVVTDDFGDVPPVCVEGRDVERYHRHQRQLARVLSIDGQQIVLDRPVALEVPVAANPRLVPVNLLEGVEVTNLALRANCPESMIDSFSEADCTNSEVLDDDGLMMVWTDGGLVQSVSGQGFGKFTIQARDTLETTIRDCEMHHPAAYGSGGQGYGVHLIGASRTIVSGERVTHARHGVVVDFGSSDSQILNSDLSDMNQALVDVHGESSRDTLIRGNTLQNATLGVIVGGGGRAVHCNDEPRHHVERNLITNCSIAGVSISDYTREVSIRFNEIDTCSTFVIATFGARDIDVSRNILGEAAITPITVALADSGEVRVTRNLFRTACGPEDAFLALGQADPPTLSENQYECSSD